MELKEIVSDPRAREALRIGDVYSTLFEYYAKAGENQQAWKIVEDMKKNNYQVNRYLDIQYVRISQLKPLLLTQGSLNRSVMQLERT